MSKKSARQRPRSEKRQRQSRHRRKTFVLAGLILCLGLTSVLIAQWRATRVAGRTNALLASPAPQPPPTLSPSSPSREYIYAGGKVIATEEPQATATPTPTPGNRINVALASNGGTASASSEYNSTNYPAGRANNGDRKGPGSSGLGDYWNDATPNNFSDELVITFNGNKTIDEIDLFCLQDNYTNPIAPTETLTFSQYGLTGFNIEYWTGSAWASIPDASVSNNYNVWRKFTFTSVTASKIRVVPTTSPDGYSRITELEAWGSDAAQSETNVALSSNGGTATASSEYSSGYAASRANNGDRKGPGPGGGGDYWNDSGANTFPDWLQIQFSGQKTIHRIELFMLQDAYWAPVDPPASLEFTNYGLRDFQVQYWTGSEWFDVPGANVTNNNKVWRTFTFSDISTSKVRVLVTGTPDGWSRLTEIEAWGN